MGQESNGIMYRGCMWERSEGLEGVVRLRDGRGPAVILPCRGDMALHLCGVAALGPLQHRATKAHELRDQQLRRLLVAQVPALG